MDLSYRTMMMIDDVAIQKVIVQFATVKKKTEDPRAYRVLYGAIQFLVFQRSRLKFCGNKVFIWRGLGWEDAQLSNSSVL